MVFFITTHERGVGLTQGCSSAALAFLTLLKSDLFKQQNLSLVLSKKNHSFYARGRIIGNI
jgi:diaminopimelate epimerase